MKMSFRAALMAAIVTVLCCTFAIVWWSASHEVSGSVDAMAEALSEETVGRVERETAAQMREATAAASLAEKYLRAAEAKRGAPLTHDDLADATYYFHDLLKAFPRLAYVSVSLDATGEYAHAQRAGNELRAVEMWREASGRAVQRDFVFQNRRRLLKKTDPDRQYDPRQRPFYTLARRERQPAWTDTYAFVDGAKHAPGFSLTTPLFGADGRLRYVVTTDFTLESLCEFLKTVRVGQTGYAFVVNRQRNGALSVVAHPDKERLLTQRNGETALTPLAELRDPIIRAFLSLEEVQTYVGEEKPLSLWGDLLGQRYLGAYAHLRAMPDPHLNIGLVVPAHELTGRVQQHELAIQIAAVAGFAIGLLLTLLISAAVASPLQQIALQTAEVGKFHFDLPSISGSSVTEVNGLAEGVEQMKLSLRAFEKYVPTDLIRRVLASGQEPALGGEWREMSIYFCDIAGFTGITRNLHADALLPLLGEFMDAFSRQIYANGGTVDKYIGDNIMAFWGAPTPSDDHALQACLTALQNQKKLAELQASWETRGLPPLRARIGIHSGPTLVGNVGCTTRLNYTVLGDTVNVANRIEGLNKQYGTTILISDTTRRQAGEALLTRAVDWVSVAGRDEPILLHEPLGLVGDTPPRLVRLAELSERALEYYRARRWQEAIICFEEMLSLNPADVQATIFLSRCWNYQHAAPPDDWQGVFVAPKM